MKPISQVWWLVYDYGANVSVAQKLAEMSAGVYYFNPSIINGFPDHKPASIGVNVPGVIKVKEYESVLPHIDAVYFPDVHEPAKQLYFMSIGKFVFGCINGSRLELDRVYLKNKMMELGLPVNEWDSAVGLDELEEKLKEKKDVYVKSGLRGDMETWHHEDPELSEGQIGDLRHQMDLYRNMETYTMEAALKKICEPGIDTQCIDGVYPETVFGGLEIKDTGFLGMFCKYKEMPKQIRNVMDKLSETLREARYRGSISAEIVIAENMKGYLLDLTCRLPHPPGDLYMALIVDYADVAWKIAQGIVPEIKYKYKYGVQLIIKSDKAKQGRSVRIRVPEEYKENVTLKNMMILPNGLWAFADNNNDMQECGSVLGWGESARQAINMAKKVADSIEGFGIKINTDCLSSATEQIEAMHKAGINYM